MAKRPKAGPKIQELTDHAAFTSYMAKLHRNEIEHFFFRTVRNRDTAIILRELAYWFDSSGKDRLYPRASVFRHGCYWVARTQKQWRDDHGVERKQVERAYEQTKDFVERKNMKFGSDRVTHWRFKFPRLLELFHQDPKIAALLQTDDEVEETNTSYDEQHPPAGVVPPECSSAPLNTNIAECSAVSDETNIPECTPSSDDGGQTHPQPSEQRKQTTSTTGFAGPADAGTGGISPSALSGAAAPEPPRQGQSYLKDGTLDPARVLKLLESVRGLPWQEKQIRLSSSERRVHSAISYLMLWQRDFEREHPKRRYPFKEQDVKQAWDLAEEEISQRRFYNVLTEAHNIVGPKKGNNPFFMSQFHSHEFEKFCKHFNRIEGELVREELIEPE